MTVHRVTHTYPAGSPTVYHRHAWLPPPAPLTDQFIHLLRGRYVLPLYCALLSLGCTASLCVTHCTRDAPFCACLILHHYLLAVITTYLTVLPSRVTAPAFVLSTIHVRRSIHLDVLTAPLYPFIQFLPAAYCTPHHVRYIYLPACLRLLCYLLPVRVLFCCTYAAGACVSFRRLLPLLL